MAYALDHQIHMTNFYEFGVRITANSLPNFFEGGFEGCAKSSVILIQHKHIKHVRV